MSQVLLLGGDVAAFAAALDLAEVGVKVWIADTSVRVPGSEVRDGGGEVAGFLTEVAAPDTAGAPSSPAAAPATVEQHSVLLRARDGEWRPVPEPSLWGIPTVPLARSCLDMLGTRGAFRAYLDRLKPVLTIGKASNFGKLVEVRLGDAVRETTVEPLVYERFGVTANDAEVALVEPGLNEALTRAGSLSGGALQQLEAHVARETVIEPLTGWQRFGDVLIEHLALYGAEIFPHGVRSCHPAAVDANGGDAAAAEPAAVAPNLGAAPTLAQHAGWIVTDRAGGSHRFDAILGGLHEVSAAISAAPEGALTDPADGSPSLASLLAANEPALTRTYVEIGIYGEGASAPVQDDTEKLFLVAAPGGATWAARSIAAPGGGARLRLSGPATQAGSGIEPPITAAVSALGVSQAAEGLVVRTGAAAFATAAARAEQHAAGEALAEARGDLLVVGASQHGGSLGAAIGDARERAVRLRRKLTGISE